jgi:hypothetical protein
VSTLSDYYVDLKAFYLSFSALRDIYIGRILKFRPFLTGLYSAILVIFTRIYKEN